MNNPRILGYSILILATALGIAIGLLIARLPISISEGLNLAGSFGGAAIAVIGALIVLEWDHRQQGIDRRRVIAALVEDVAKKVEQVRNPDLRGFEGSPAIAQMVAARALSQAIERAKGAHVHFAPTTIGMVRAFSTIESMTIDLAAIKSDLQPARFYAGATGLDSQLSVIELKAKQALAELQIHRMPISVDVD